MRILFSFLLFTFSFASTAQIPSYVPTNGLVGYWPFNGNANDESGNGNNGTVNGATLTTDRFGNSGKAYSFNGNGNYISTTNINSSIFLNGITISLWVKVTQPNSQLVHFFVSKERDNVAGHFHVGYNGYGNKFYAQTHDNSDYINTRITSNYQNLLPQTNWHHVVLTYDNQNIKFYIDNNDVVIRPYSLPIVSSISPIFFGTNNFPGYQYYLLGLLDDIAIYNRALTPQEITQLYTSSVTPITPEDTTSNVGIGTTTPKRRLHINDVMRLEPRDTAPTNPAKGDIYFDGVLNKLRYYNGTGWISL